MGLFNSMLGNVKDSKKESENEKLLKKIEKMDLGEMRLYVNGKFDEYKLSEYGLSEIVNKLKGINKNTSHYYLRDDDMDSKKKKVFDLILLILGSKKISINILELVQNFLEIYTDIIKKYDKENKQIYEKKIKKSISLTIDKINFKSDQADKMRTLN